MSKLWCFGDSFTFGHGCRTDCTRNEYYNNYWKEGDDIWVNLLAKELNVEPINLGKSAVSNDYILDCIIDNFDKIVEDDYVSINITFPQRFDVENKRTKKLQSVLGELPALGNDERWKSWLEIYCETEEEIETLINFTLFFYQSSLIMERQDKRFEFVRNRFVEKGVKVFMWKTDDVRAGFEKINQATKNKIYDGHFSFQGHKDFSKYALTMFKGKNIF